MPLYEYYCPPCGGQFEVRRSLADMDTPAVCPSGHTTSSRVLSLFAPISKSTQSGGAATATLDAPAAVGGCDAVGGCSCC